MLVNQATNAARLLPHPVRAAWAARFGGLPRTYWALWRTILVNRLGGCVEPFLVLYFAHRGLGTAMVGVVVAVFGVGALVVQPISGILSDRIGRRETFALGMFGAAFSFGLLGAAQSLWLLVIASFCVGFFVEMYRPASNALIADLVESKDRPRAYALAHWVQNIGFAVAAVVAGVLAEAGFGILFTVDAISCLLCAVLVLRGVARSTSKAKKQTQASLRVALRDRVLISFCLLVAISETIYQQGFSSLALMMKEVGFGSASYGFVIAINGLLIVILQPLVLHLVPRANRRYLLAGGTAMIGIGMSLEGVLPGALGFALPVIIWTLGEIAFAAVALAVVADRAPPHMRGRYQGIYGMAFALAFICAPLLGSQILATSGADMLRVICVVGGLFVAVCMFRLKSAFTPNPAVTAQAQIPASVPRPAARNTRRRGEHSTKSASGGRELSRH